MPLTLDLPQTRDAAHAFYEALLAEAKTKRGKDEVERWLGRHDLFYLLTRLLRRPDADRDWLFDRCRMVQAEPDGYLDLWSREHYKSTIITFAKTIQDILVNPDITCAIFSHTKRIARGFMSQIAREFEDNERLKDLYPDVLWKNPRKEAPQWSEEAGIIVKRKSNPKECTLEAHGLVDGQPTSRHFLLMIFDDTVTLESVSTGDQIEKTTNAWSIALNLGTQQEHGGRVRYIGTRYNLHDTYAEMIKRGAAKPRIFPATHNGRFDGTPVFFSQAEWDKRVKSQGRATVAAQLLQNPMADASATFQVHWLKSYEVRPRTLNVYICCDPSMGRTSTSDNTAMAVIGVSATGGKYLLDGFCHRMQLSERWANLKKLYRKWSATPGVQHVAVGYERYGMQSDIEYFDERMRIEKIHFPIQELNWTRDNTQSKQERVSRLEPDFRNGRFYLPAAIMARPPADDLGDNNATLDFQPCYWEVGDDPAEKQFNELIVRRAKGLTRQQMDQIRAGSSDLIAQAIVCKDAEGRRYDLTMAFISEYETFPFGRLKDLIDAVSRVYDMEPAGPTLTSAEMSEPTVFWDA